MKHHEWIGPILLGLTVFLGLGAFAQQAPVCVLPVTTAIGMIQSPLIGVKIYYADGSVTKIPAVNLRAGWIAAHADGVQVVQLYYEATYGANGAERHYAETLEGKNFYYWSPTKGFGNVDFVREVPADVVAVKIGTLLTEGAFLRIYNKAHNDHEF